MTVDPKGISAEGRITEIPILSADNRPMFCFAIFFAIFDFFSFWESIKKTQVSKNVFFWIEILRSLQNLQILKIANFFVENPEMHRPKADHGIGNSIKTVSLEIT